jgi:tripartite-type tricarboxylate transporter receptor subunit TctC
MLESPIRPSRCYEPLVAAIDALQIKLDWRTKLLYATAIVLGSVSIAHGQSQYPSRTIKIIAPSQPGGGVDLIARTIGDLLSGAFGQPVVIENLSGGAGVVPSVTTARAAPDGYTLMVAYVGTHGTRPAVGKLPYDAVKDFTPIAMVAGTPNVFVIAPDVPASSLKEFVAYAKANPGNLSYGSGGAGTLTHLAMEQFKLEANFDIVHIPYRAIASAFTDLLGGRTQAMLPGLAAALPYIKTAKVKPLAVTGARRDPLLPYVPTFEELGYEGFDDVQWYGIVGPANLPSRVVERLNHEITTRLETSKLRERLSGEALEPMPMTPEQFGRYICDDIAHWRKVAKERKIESTD